MSEIKKKSLQSRKCPCCGKPKQYGLSFCGGCYQRLPSEQKNTLYDEKDYDLAMDAALHTLGVSTPYYD